MKSYNIIGTSQPRVDALEKVTGSAMFTADYNTPKMLHLKAVRSELPHGKIVSLDTTEAEKLSGVRGALRPEDVPDKRSESVLRIALYCRGIKLCVLLVSRLF